LSKYINRETISYLIVGALTTLISFVFFVLPVYFGVGTIVSNLISHATGILFAYFANKIFVFRSKGWGTSFVIKEITMFFGTRIGTYVLETALLLLLVDVLGFSGTIMKICTMGLVVVGNYVLGKWVVFRTGAMQMFPKEAEAGLEKDSERSERFPS